jgi:hypothetical protein
MSTLWLGLMVWGGAGSPAKMNKREGQLYLVLRSLRQHGSKVWWTSGSKRLVDIIGEW